MSLGAAPEIAHNRFAKMPESFNPVALVREIRLLAHELRLLARELRCGVTIDQLFNLLLTSFIFSATILAVSIGGALERLVASAFLLFFAMFCLRQVRSVRHKEDG